jgi:glucose-1-phosphate adenylyltransferase
MKNVLTMVLAGGKGERLHPLTLHRAKPAVSFGGKYRIIDITLSNCFNSGLRKIAVLIQYKSWSLNRHIRTAWSILNPEVGEYIVSVPPQQRISEDWYRGTADAVHQNMFLLDNERADYLLILAGDHIYKMNYAEMYEFMVEKQADAVVGALEFPIAEATRFGVIGVGDDFRIHSWDEKPANPAPMPGDPNQALVSMGIYLFKTDVIRSYLTEDAPQESAHDFGKNIIPQMIQQGRVYAFKFHDKNKKAVKYWRDIGTLDAYWETNMDLVAVDPLFNLYDQDWPLRTYQGQFPPAKFVFAQDYAGGRMGVALDSIVCGGCIISGARVQNSVLSPDVIVQDYSEVRESIVMERVRIGEQCKIRRAIIDKDVIIPAKTEIGYDLDLDRKRFHVTESGLVVISKGMKLDAALNPPG